MLTWLNGYPLGVKMAAQVMWLSLYCKYAFECSRSLVSGDASSDDEGDEGNKAIGALAKALVKSQEMNEPKKKKRLQLFPWILAVNRFAVAAEAIGMWSFAAAQAHIEICAKIAGMALIYCSNTLLFAVICLYCQLAPQVILIARGDTTSPKFTTT